MDALPKVVVKGVIGRVERRHRSRVPFDEHVDATATALDGRSMPTQCVPTAVIGAAFCAKRCSSEALAKSLAFFPPDPPSYDIERANGETRARYNAARGTLPEAHARAFQRVLDACEATTRETTRGNEIVILACEAPWTVDAASATGERTGGATIVFSHGNAVDAGEVAPFARKLAQQLECRVVTYDYSGYGRSRGEASVADTHADIDAAVRHVRERYGVERREIILLGQSIGSGPTCAHASKNPGFGAVVLVSPLLSALSVVSSPSAWCTPAKVFKSLDVYKNYQHVKSAQCPFLLVHGELDAVVHVSHGEALWAAIKKTARPEDLVLEPYWIQGAGHDDTYDRNPAEFIRRLREVCALVRERCRQV